MSRYVGARYVPVQEGYWDDTKAYEPLSVVMYQGDSYTSKKYVPVGINITNTEYWVMTGEFNQQMASINATLQTQGEVIRDLQADATRLQGEIDDLDAEYTNFVNETFEDAVYRIAILEGKVPRESDHDLLDILESGHSFLSKVFNSHESYVLEVELDETKTIVQDLIRRYDKRTSNPIVLLNTNTTGSPTGLELVSSVIIGQFKILSSVLNPGGKRMLIRMFNTSSDTIAVRTASPGVIRIWHTN